MYGAMKYKSVIYSEYGVIQIKFIWKKFHIIKLSTLTLLLIKHVMPYTEKEWSDIVMDKSFCFPLLMSLHRYNSIILAVSVHGQILKRHAVPAWDTI